MQNFVPAAKMNGSGNAILIMDMRGEDNKSGQKNKITPGLVRLLAQQQSTAFDQLMVLYDRESAAQNAAYQVEIWNCDGTKAKACGNGTRCLAEYLWRRQRQHDKNGAAVFSFATAGGPVTAMRRSNGAITVTMGRPRFDPPAIPINFTPEDMNYVPLAALLPPGKAAPGFTALFPTDAAVLSIGNPHAVFFLPAEAPQPLAAWPLAEFGAMLEKSPVFPEGVNVSLAQITAPDCISLRVWERGAGLTQACGTAACAAAIAALRRGLINKGAPRRDIIKQDTLINKTAQRRGLAGQKTAGHSRNEAEIKVTLPGGPLIIGLADGLCRLTGPTEYEYAGFITLADGVFHRHSEGAGSDQDTTG
ncbi:diaminopimelate epimerase [Candidatus Tokpelaia sp.]|uniref:diaminopimelate epimerase n=1 Tax=Candidatus Tokpelaia sp. TaxID=2233777 RepID=UPI00123B1DE9|nr:diaminopimelate epimerase [Candidatus Tokpelaia sp.]KAA6406077.1 diaminopimelate epimerase [Candidatus Tokpelaia sp.]